MSEMLSLRTLFWDGLVGPAGASTLGNVMPHLSAFNKSHHHREKISSTIFTSNTVDIPQTLLHYTVKGRGDKTQ